LRESRSAPFPEIRSTHSAILEQVWGEAAARFRLAAENTGAGEP
jgi:hypothetical protein